MLVARKKTHSEIIAKVIGTINAEVFVPDGTEELALGTILTTNDGGLTFEPLLVEVHIADNAYATDDKVFYNGSIWTSTVDNNVALPNSANNWTEDGTWNACGVLCDYITTTETASVLTMGSIIKRNLPDFNDSMRVSLFQNKINLV